MPPAVHCVPRYSESGPDQTTAGDRACHSTQYTHTHTHTLAALRCCRTVVTFMRMLRTRVRCTCSVQHECTHALTRSMQWCSWAQSAQRGSAPGWPVPPPCAVRSTSHVVCRVQSVCRVAGPGGEQQGYQHLLRPYPTCVQTHTHTHTHTHKGGYSRLLVFVQCSCCPCPCKRVSYTHTHNDSLPPYVCACTIHVSSGRA